jgi:hypothetical protein
MYKTKHIYHAHNNCNLADAMTAESQQQILEFSPFVTNVTIASNGKSYAGTTAQLSPPVSYMIIPQALKDISASLYRLLTQYNSNPQIELGAVTITPYVGSAIGFSKAYLVKPLAVQSDPSIPVSCEIQYSLR